MILACAAACQPTADPRLPALASVTPLPAWTAAPTHLRAAASAVPVTAAPTASSTPDVPPDATLEPALLTQVAVPTAQVLPPGTQLLGRSAGGRALLVRSLPALPPANARVLLLVGGIHGGWEANTVALINALIAHFDAQPGDIPPGIALDLVPVANPDGLPLGREGVGRFNGAGVDLNRNWGCGWQREAYWRDLAVNPGPAPFSEPETNALADYIRARQPAVVLFYHSAAGGVFAGACAESSAGAQGTADSAALSAVYGEAAGYRFGEAFAAYPVSGTAPSWVAGLGIASADVELQTWTDSEVERNLRAVLAVMGWMASRDG